MSWGTKLAVAMGLFMIFILTLGFRMIFSNSDTLIEKDYYEQGLNYNQKYDAKRLAVTDSVIPKIETDNHGLSIRFILPASCKLNFKRLSDSKMDRTIERQTDEEDVVHIAEGELKSGPWMLSVNYSINEKNYLYEQEILMP
ncbi:FixH family protein [Desertivirga xinjiangensis]|uniref:FixH family protein n=1 Tax=Desertivirga xinjiangensis TaxID=539206 RepID=UPI00210E6DDB|nr:FixH family protein [Pedobacter xinjiangensis]